MILPSQVPNEPVPDLIISKDLLYKRSYTYKIYYRRIDVDGNKLGPYIAWIDADGFEDALDSLRMHRSNQEAIITWDSFKILKPSAEHEAGESLLAWLIKETNIRQVISCQEAKEYSHGT